MSKKESKIKCPNCGIEIDINEVIYHDMEEELKKEYSAMLNENRKKMEAQLKNKYDEEKKNALVYYEEELKKKNEEVKEFTKAKYELEKVKLEKEELEEKIKAENEIRLLQKLKEEREKIQKNEEEKSGLRIKERDQIIEQLQRQLSEAQRKAEQSSMQLQGEVQELAIEEWLKSNFPLDTIDEIKKGARGGDCLQTVNTECKKNCGTIYYESKRAKDFQPVWVEKFKADMRDKGADIGVLVTETMPKEMERFGQRDGIWICSFDEFKALCYALRETVIRVNTAMSSQENKGDKMTLLYSFLTSNEFKMQIEAIVEGFVLMKEDLDRERRSMEGLWKRREKQLEKVILNTNNMYNSIKGIAGRAIPEIKALQLPEE